MKIKFMVDMILMSFSFSGHGSLEWFCRSIYWGDFNWEQLH